MATEFNATIGGAFRAYKSAQDMPASKVFDGEIVRGPSFTQLIEQSARDAVETVRAGDRAAVAGLQGKMSTQEVIEATMAMESALKLTTSVRDRMVEAYQEVLRMSV